MTPRHRRFAIGLAVFCAMGLATALVLNALGSNLVFFYTPTQVAAQEAPAGRPFRVGGLVAPGSVQREGLAVRFVVTDTAQQLVVRYEGVLPDLFAEGQGVVAQGRLGEGGEFIAHEILAKHDENYMPPEAGAALKAAQGGAGAPVSEKAADTPAASLRSTAVAENERPARGAAQ